MIIKNAELWFPKLDRPSARFNKKNPTYELQIRTYDKEVKKYWEEIGLRVKAVIPDEGDPYYRVNLRKRSIKEDGTKASPVRAVNGNLEDIDPKIIGNGSVGNVRVFQYTYPLENNEEGKANVLMEVQVTKLKVYHPKPRDDEFEETETEIVDQV